MGPSENVHRPQPLKVVSTATDGITVITVTGEIDHNSAAPLVHALEPDAVAAHRVVVDMRHVAFMDCSGINVLLAAHRDLTTAGGWLRLAGVQNSVLRILHLVGLDTVIGCHPSLHDALNAQ
ncbi:anti-anti-sigma factor [Streptomyces sp. 2231.1]|uniref:STAS domain-containing protein n=1 Tax=Streptomyces sp. 2231.1 TaxID=1855347 RepID=UPI000898A70B|nr:STAS domain-containing protein [Streptomyces sp. 2231.1]SEE67662.1 anti-anti-sigma factor [Streptomyces sp. 2231.1]